MEAGITSYQMTEVEAYSRVEADPEGPELRLRRIAEAQKAPFQRAITAAAKRK